MKFCPPIPATLSALARKVSRTSCQVSEGLIERINAANPATVGDENELRILGKEVGKQTSGEAEIVGNEIELNNYPNPFNPSTTISYSLPEAGNVQIKIFDVLGREVAKLVDETKNAGKHTIIWNGSNNASGIYFYTITFQNQTLFKKMLMIK